MPTSEAEAKFLRDCIDGAKPVVEDLWINTCALPVMPKQAWHGINSAILAVVTSHVASVQIEQLIDLAAEPINDPLFEDLLREPDVRAGIRSLVSDTRIAAQSWDLRRLSEILQVMLIMPLGGRPSRLKDGIPEAVLACAARIGSDAVALALMHPRASIPSRDVGPETVPPVPTLGPVSDFLLDSGRVLAGQPTSRPVSGAPKFIMGVVGFILLAFVLNALDATCAQMIR